MNSLILFAYFDVTHTESSTNVSEKWCVEMHPFLLEEISTRERHRGNPNGGERLIKEEVGSMSRKFIQHWQGWQKMYASCRYGRAL